MEVSNELLTSDNESFQIQEKGGSRGKEKNPGGRPLSSVWTHFERIMTETAGKFGAICKYCETNWKRVEVSTLEEHLASHCKHVPVLVLREHMQKVTTRENAKKRKLESGQSTMLSFHDPEEIPDSRINRINRAMRKFFIACGVSFRIVEHPFFIDLVKELNASYDPQLVSIYLLVY